MLAHDVEIAVRAHDYIEAQRVFHESLRAIGGRRKLAARIDILSRPTIAIAFAILDDELAIEELESIAEYRDLSQEVSAGRVVKARSNRVYLDVVRWINEVIRKGDPVERAALDAEASSRGYPKLNQTLKMMRRHRLLYERSGLVYRGEEPEDDDAATGIPFFHHYFSSPEDMDVVQRSFYEKTVKPAFACGEYIDLGKSESYGFALIFEYVNRMGFEDIPALRAFLTHALTLYDGPSIQSHLRKYFAETFFLESNFQRGYDLLIENHDLGIHHFLGLTGIVKASRVTGNLAWDWTTAKRLTTFGKQHKAEVLVEVGRLLDDEHQARGRSVVHDLWDAVTIGRDPDGLVPDWVFRLAGDVSVEVNHIARLGPTPPVTQVFQRLMVSGVPHIDWPSPLLSEGSEYSMYWFSYLIRKYLDRVFSVAENVVREQRGVPRKGEGWVTELELFHRLLLTFPETTVIHQGRPRWLLPQSIDIFFPDWRIAVEYQGLQHVQPVSRFGGMPAFGLQLERDARKRMLCENNNHTLIEVFPGYDLEEVVAQIRRAIR